MNRYTAVLTLVLLALVAGPSAAAVPPVPTEALTLDRALEITRANLPALRQARAQVEQARGLYDEARAGWYPTVSIALAYKRTTGNIAASPGFTTAGEALPAATLNSYNSFTNSVVASQLLWDFGQTSNKVASTVETARAQQETARTALLQAELAVRAAFFVAAAQNDLVRVAEDNLTNNDTHLAETQAFVKEGTQPEIALATAEANRANAVVQLITAKNAYSTAKTRLNQTMGVQGSTVYDLQVPPSALVPQEDAPLEQLVAEALSTRPEEAALEAQCRSARANIKAADDTWYPTVSLTAGASDNGTTADTNGRQSLILTPNVNAGLALSWTLNLGPLVPGEIRVAKAQLASVSAQLDALHVQVRVDVETAQLAVKAARESLVAAAQAREAADTQLRLANGRYRAGVGNAVEVSDAQLAADQAGAQAVQARLNLDTARAQLVEALGRI
jgi:outer membrane protein